MATSGFDLSSVQQQSAGAAFNQAASFNSMIDRLTGIQEANNAAASFHVTGARVTARGN